VRLDLKVVGGYSLATVYHTNFGFWILGYREKEDLLPLHPHALISNLNNQPLGVSPDYGLTQAIADRIGSLELKMQLKQI
jgi:hypothetical protein